VKDLVYSLDEENYYDSDEIKDRIEVERHISTLYVAKKVTYSHKDFIILSDLTDWMIDYAYDEASEWAESYLKDITNEKAKELELKIIALFNENVKQPTFLP